MKRNDLSTQQYTAELLRAGFRAAIGPEMPLASASILNNVDAPGRLFRRRGDCQLRVALQLLLTELARVVPRGSRRRGHA